MNKFKTQILILNADGQPLCVVDLAKAIGMLYIKKTAIQLDFYQDIKIKDASGIQYAIPAVMMLKKMVKRQYQNVPFNRKNVLIRDKCRCQYCGELFKPFELTYDHVIPRSKWKGASTPTCWENIVMACIPCNRRKADRTPEASQMRLMTQPKKPTYTEITLGLSPYSKIPNEWTPYVKHLLKSLDFGSTKRREKQQYAAG